MGWEGAGSRSIREPEDLPGGPAQIRPDAGVALDKRLLTLRIKKLGASLSPLGLRDFFIFEGNYDQDFIGRWLPVLLLVLGLAPGFPARPGLRSPPWSSPPSAPAPRPVDTYRHIEGTGQGTVPRARNSLGLYLRQGPPQGGAGTGQRTQKPAPNSAGVARPRALPGWRCSRCTWFPARNGRRSSRESRQVPGLKVALGKPLLSDAGRDGAGPGGPGQDLSPGPAENRGGPGGPRQPQPSGASRPIWTLKSCCAPVIPAKMSFWVWFRENPAGTRSWPQVKRGGATSVLLVPFLLVAGEHVNTDILGDGPESWKSRLQAQGSFQGGRAAPGPGLQRRHYQHLPGPPPGSLEDFERLKNSSLSRRNRRAAWTWPPSRSQRQAGTRRFVAALLALSLGLLVSVALATGIGRMDVGWKTVAAVILGKLGLYTRPWTGPPRWSSGASACPGWCCPGWWAPPWPPPGWCSRACCSNPLADPFTLGVSTGAALGVALLVMLGVGGSYLGLSPLPLGALVGRPGSHGWRCWSCPGNRGASARNP